MTLLHDLFTLLFVLFMLDTLRQQKRIRHLFHRQREINDQLTDAYEKLLLLLTPSPAARITFYLAGQEITEMNQKVTETKTYSIKIKDAKGNPAQVDGAPAWSLTDPALGTLTPSADGMSASLEPAGPIGAAELQVNADADLGEGVVTILGTAPIEFIAGDAVSVEIAQD